MARYLTKSRFKLAQECPTKLFYTKKKDYADQKMDDPFLAALADGGFQVGELAKYYFPNGHDIVSLDYEESLAQTNALMTQENVVIYEAAICYENLFIRVDVLEKIGNQINLIEVKAKSVHSSDPNPFTNKRGQIQTGWRPYLEDVTFQKYVTEQAFPNCKITAFLMLADKDAQCPSDGLNQKFKLVEEDGRKSIHVPKAPCEDDLEPRILAQIDVDDISQQILNAAPDDEFGMSFIEKIQHFSDYYAKDIKIKMPIARRCAGCEFHRPESETALKSGKVECFKEQLNWTEKDVYEPLIFDIWNLHYRKKESLIAERRLKISEINEDDINPKEDSEPGISASERQWLQVEKIQQNDSSAWFDKENLRKEIDSWTFPLHFIDFETTKVAIPFNKGRQPYEGVAFQFSHHIVYEDGRIEHKGEYLNTKPGYFPNYDFIRALKAELDKDSGSIFRYSNHENSFLNEIYYQIRNERNSIPDRNELCDFIKRISHSSGSSDENWQGERDMIDLWQLVKRYYYDPYTGGSNSIKYVLPAILNRSDFLKSFYAKAIYGNDAHIKSLNFRDWTWIQFDENNQVIDPYKLLPKMFSEIPENEDNLISEESELKDGGAAMTAYGKLQFEELSDFERREIEQALLKYCELDTLAMVMIYQGFNLPSQV